MRSRVRHGLLYLALLTAALPRGTGAAVFDITPADVTPRSFSVIWISDGTLIDATVKVFADAAGTAELTGALGVSLASGSASLGLGIVKVDVTGAAADTCVYVQTETTEVGGPVQSPAAPPFLQVCTPVSIERARVPGGSIANDVLLHAISLPDSAPSADGTLLVVSAPGLAAHPVSAFVDDALAPPSGAPDLNNLYASADGASLEVVGGDALAIVEFRGQLCGDPVDQRLLRFRRAPVHEEEPALGTPITELELPEPCFFADAVCDDTVNILDAQRVLNILGATTAECSFNPDLDIVGDGVIDILDVQSVLNRFGESAPFAP